MTDENYLISSAEQLEQVRLLAVVCRYNTLVCDKDKLPSGAGEYLSSVCLDPRYRHRSGGALPAMTSLLERFELDQKRRGLSQNTITLRRRQFDLYERQVGPVDHMTADSVQEWLDGRPISE